MDNVASYYPRPVTLSTADGAPLTRAQTERIKEGYSFNWEIKRLITTSLFSVKSCAVSFLLIHAERRKMICKSYHFKTYQSNRMFLSIMHHKKKIIGNMNWKNLKCIDNDFIKNDIFHLPFTLTPGCWFFWWTSKNWLVEALYPKLGLSNCFCILNIEKELKWRQSQLRF